MVAELGDVEGEDGAGDDSGDGEVEPGLVVGGLAVDAAVVADGEDVLGG